MKFMLVTLNQWLQTIKGPLLSLMTSLEITAVTTVWESGGRGDDRIWWLEFGVGRHLTPYPSCFLEHRSLKNRYWGLQYIDTGHNHFLFLPTEVDIIGKIMKTTDWPDWPSKKWKSIYGSLSALFIAAPGPYEFSQIVAPFGEWLGLTSHSVDPLHLEGMTGLFMAIWFIFV